MNLSELQADLRHFAAEREWQPFHTPKNLSTALMVEAAELAELFQWMSPAESRVAHETPASKQRIGEEVADVLLYLLQVADHCRIDIATAVKDKLARNARKYPARRTLPRSNPEQASVPDTHVLLDYENVQPTESELRAMVPDASRLWVFHGPHQRNVDERFTSYGEAATAVPISRQGKNALDFHLSFYMGYIASRKPAPTIVVVANDQGYAPMIDHAKAMGFAVRQLAHGPARSGVKKAVSKKVSNKNAVAAKVPTKKAAAKQPILKRLPVKQVPTKKAAAPKTAAKKAVEKKVVAKTTAAAAIAADTPAATAVSTLSAPSATPVMVSSGVIAKIIESLVKMGGKRPGKPASLRRALKSFLGAETGDESIEVALRHLIAAGAVALDARSDVSYPGLAKSSPPGSSAA